MSGISSSVLNAFVGSLAGARISMSPTVSCPAAKRSHRLGPFDARQRPQAGEKRIGDRHRLAQRNTRDRHAEPAQRLARSRLRPRDRGRARAARHSRRISATRSASDVTPSATCSTRSCSSVTAPDSNSHRRSAGRSASADSSSTQAPASNMCRSCFRISGCVSGGGASSRGSRSASEAIVPAADERKGVREQRRRRGIASNGRYGGELFERPVQRSRVVIRACRQKSPG